MKNSVITFLLARRSVVAKKMLPQPPSKADLDIIIDCGLRVPDHGNLQPWQLVTLEGESRKMFDEQVILEVARSNSDTPLSDVLTVLESTRMQRSGAIIAVLYTPVIPHKIPLWEQELCAGAVCTTLLYAAQSLDYAAQWITEWPAYDATVVKALGGNPETDKIVGFIHIGQKEQQPAERSRPDKADKVRSWDAI